MRADWTNPSNPQPCQDGPTTETDHKKIAETFTEYSKPLFAKKPIDPEAKRKALQSLRNE